MTYRVVIKLEMVAEGIEEGEDKPHRDFMDAVEHNLSITDANDMYESLTNSLASGWSLAKHAIRK